jgi:hypothetical protein
MSLKVSYLPPVTKYHGKRNGLSILEDTDGRQPEVGRFIMEIDILGVDLAK